MPDNNTLTNIKGKKITAHDDYYDIERDDNNAFLIVGYSKDHDRDNYKLSLNELYDAFEDKISERISEIIANETKAFNIDYGSSLEKYDITYQGSNVLPPAIKAYESIELIFTPKWGYKVQSGASLASAISGCSVDYEEHKNGSIITSVTVVLSKPTDTVTINANATLIQYNINIFYKYQEYDSATESFIDAGPIDFNENAYEIPGIVRGAVVPLNNIIGIINDHIAPDDNDLPGNYNYNITWSNYRDTGISCSKTSSTSLNIQLNSNVANKNPDAPLELVITVQAVKKYLVGFVYHHMLESIIDNDTPFFNVYEENYNGIDDHGIKGDPRKYKDSDDTIALKNPAKFIEKLASIDGEQHSDLFGNMLYYINENELSSLKGKSFNLYTPSQIVNNYGGNYSGYAEYVNDDNVITEIGDKNYVWLICPVKEATIGLELIQKQASEVYNNTFHLSNSIKTQFTAGMNYPLEIYASSEPSPTSIYRIGGTNYYMIPFLIEVQTVVNIKQKG